jgi:ABC-type proline/glycine betaine transport system substrate-binding protein
MKAFFVILGFLGAMLAAQAANRTVSLGQVAYRPVPIPSASATSAAIATEGMSPVGCQFPAALTSTTVTFQSATTLAGTYGAIYNSSGQVSYTVAASRYVSFNPADFYGVQYMKIVLGSAEAAARTLTCSLKGI